MLYYKGTGLKPEGRNMYWYSEGKICTCRDYKDYLNWLKVYDKLELVLPYYATIKPNSMTDHGRRYFSIDSDKGHLYLANRHHFKHLYKIFGVKKVIVYKENNYTLNDLIIGYVDKKGNEVFF